MYPSPHAPLDIPATPLAEFVLGRAATYGQRAALIEAGTGRTITYAQLPSLVERAAASLARLGIAKGDVCAIFAANTPEYLIAFLAVARLGAVVTTASPLYTKADLKKQLDDSGARLLFTLSTLAPTWQEALEGTAVEHIVTFDAPPTAPAPRKVMPFASLVAAEGKPPRVAIEPSDLVALPYSSGTTGLPKGVMLTHRNLVVNILQSTAQQPVTADDTLVGVLPLFHIYGLNVVMNAVLRNGAT